MEKLNLSNYKAVILAGGKGTRLYPVTKEIPKPLLPVKRKPIINYLIEMFQSQGIEEIAVLINKDFREDFEWWQKRYYPSTRFARSGQVPSASPGQAPLASSGQVPKIKLVVEEEPLGTFGGLCFLKDWLKEKTTCGEDIRLSSVEVPAEPFFLTNGDELKKIDLIEMSKFHQKLKTTATIALVKVADPQHYGVVISKNGMVEEFLEKPSPSQISKRNLGRQASYVNSGLYLLSPEVLRYLPRQRVKAGLPRQRVKAGHPGPKFSMIEADLFPKLAREKKLAGFKFDGKWTDCGTWERYSRALKEWE